MVTIGEFHLIAVKLLSGAANVSADLPVVGRCFTLARS